MTNPTIQAAANVFGFRPADIIGKRRLRPLALARFAACYVMRNRDRLSYAQIGRILGGRDHSTIGSACLQAENYMARDAEYAARVALIIAASPAAIRRPSTLSKHIKPKNEMAAGDTDALMRQRGTVALTKALNLARAA